MRLVRIAALPVLLPVLAACSSPIDMPSQYTQRQTAHQAGNSHDRTVQACRVHLGTVGDLRSDTHAMGDVAGRPVRVSDSAAWVRSGVLSLDQDTRIAFVGDAADLDLNVDLLKAYVMSITMNKASTVVARVRYSRHGVDDGEQVYRGSDTSLNWASGEGETQAALDSALADLLNAIHRDVLSRCTAAPKR